MKTRYATIFSLLGCLSLAATAHAESVLIDAQGGPITLHSGNLMSIFASSSAHDFTGSDLSDVHSALQAYGVNTDGLVTFLLAETADGLGFFALMDDFNQGGGAATDSSIGFSSTAPLSADYWINSLVNDDITVNSFGSTTTASGTFQWNDNRGDAFAWTDLQHGDCATFNFSEMEGDALMSQEAFQFVTWNGDAWEVIDVAGWSQDGQFAFSFITLVPLPAPLLLGLAGLAGVAIIRRRRIF